MPAVLACALALAGACRGPEVEVTAASFFRQTQNGQPVACLGASGGDPGVMDAYIIEMYEYLDPSMIPVNARVTDCERCIASPALCKRERIICECDLPSAVTPKDLASSLTGVRLGGVDSEYPYCLRVIAIDRGSLSDTQTRSECACDDNWGTHDYLTESARMCAVSTPRSTGPLGVSLTVYCPGDGFGGGGQQGEQAPYTQCLFPTAQ